MIRKYLALLNAFFGRRMLDLRLATIKCRRLLTTGRWEHTDLSVNESEKVVKENLDGVDLDALDAALGLMNVRKFLMVKMGINAEEWRVWATALRGATADAAPEALKIAESILGDADGNYRSRPAVAYATLIAMMEDGFIDVPLLEFSKPGELAELHRYLDILRSEVKNADNR